MFFKKLRDKRKLKRLRDELANRRYDENYNNCCYLRRSAINQAIRIQYPELEYLFQ